MNTASKAQIGAIHALKSRAGLDDDSYRDLLAGVTGKRSAKDLSAAEAGRVIDRLKAVSAPAESGVSPKRRRGAPRARGALALSGPYAGVCRALWISAWHLGIVRDRTDRAMVAFVRRQTGIDHINWMRDPADGHKVVEALKGWIAREAGVEWPTEAQARKAGMPFARARKITVIAAQARILGVQASVDIAQAPTDADLDHMMQRFGECLRAVDTAKAAVS